MKASELKNGKLAEASALYAPIYIWFWNTAITKEGIKERLDEMKKCGIEAMYVLAVPANFRPQRRKTALSPEYLSQEYLDLLLYAHDYADSLGMHTWLYNEGGFPSGMACGQVVKKDVTLGKKMIEGSKTVVKKGEKLVFPENTLAAFAGDTRVDEGRIFADDTEITVYAWKNTALGTGITIATDIAMKKTTEVFLELTHEKLLATLGDRIGKQIVYMFDDESNMGNYTTGLEKIFKERFGYDPCDHLAYIMNDKAPTTRAQQQAKMDYERLCGDLVCENYFLTMNKWLNAHGMKSTGHLDLDHIVDGYRRMHYGNPMKMLRAFDVPGIDVIWEQIKVPSGENVKKSCPEGMEFFPRFAASAARQIGSNVAISETFAVYGGNMTHADMRYVLGFQAVRGINHFNFANISYEQEGVLPLQLRPDFYPTFLGNDMLASINAYTKRLQYILQENTPHIKTALYMPCNTINAGGKEAEEAIQSFEKIGEMLESRGVCFDIIDEDFVLNCKVEGSKLKNDFVCYDYVFVPMGEFELDEVKEILAKTVEKIEPTLLSDTENISARRLDGEDARYYFVFNENGEKKDFRLTFFEQKPCYEIDLYDGSVYKAKAVLCDGNTVVSDGLTSGEGKIYFFTDEEIDAKERPRLCKLGEISDFSAYVSRIFRIGEGGAENRYPAPNEIPAEVGNWDKTFSGTVTYESAVDLDIPDGDIYLDLGDVLHYAKVYVDGEEKAVVTMPPYFVRVSDVKKGSRIRIEVTNTIAGACIDTDYFDKTPIEWVGPYHQKMVVFEKDHLGGGFGGRVILYCENL